MSKPYIYVFTGTSGSGRKTTARLALKHTGIIHLPSYTDRPPREKEHPSADYRYLTPEHFDVLSERHYFTEQVKIDRYRYGVAGRELNDALREGRSVYLILNREGADRIRSLYGDRVVRIFLYVEKRLVKERLEKKGVSYEILNRYLSHYTDEVTYRKECEHVIENVDAERTAAFIREIIAGYEAGESREH